MSNSTAKAVPPNYHLCLEVSSHLYHEGMKLYPCPSRAQVYLKMDKCSLE